MIYFNLDVFRASVFAAGAFFVPLSATAALVWDPPADAPWVWNASSSNWLDGAVRTPWARDADAFFGATGATVEIEGALRAGTVTVDAPGYVFALGNGAGDRLRARRIVGTPTFRFFGGISAGADDYPSLAELQGRGLVLDPGAESTLDARLEPALGGSPVIGVRGENSVVTFNGEWIGDTGTIYSWLKPLEGGTFRLGPEADMRFIRDAFFTLQLWVAGDGTGTLEIDEGFQADRSQRGITPLGIGSIRLSNTTFITHHSRNLPITYRPVFSEGTQANGHLVFENEPGSRWIVRSNDQTYAGAVWIHRDVEISTEANLTHLGETQAAFDYTAYNGFSVMNGVAVTKTGPGRLVLAGEQAYDSNSLFLIEEGEVDFVTDPSAGTRFGGGSRVGTLLVSVGREGGANFQKRARIAGMEVAGTLGLGEGIEILDIFGASWGEESRTDIVLNGAPPSAMVDAGPFASLGGTLRVWRDPGFRPATGETFAIVRADALEGDWVIEDYSGLGLEVERTETEWRLRATRSAPLAPGEVILDEPFADLAGWQDLSTVPRWGSPLGHRSAFTTEGEQVHLIRSGEDDTRGFTGYQNTDSLKTFTALDHRFTEPVERSGAAIIVDARMRWETVTNTSGEGGRFIIALNHDYPEDGFDLTPEGTAGSKINDFSADWWARPAYHLRIRNSNTGAGSAFLQYGGGDTDLGEYEATSDWWLPGFISGAGNVAPGAGDDFPANSWVSTPAGLAREDFAVYRYVIHPDRQEVWLDESGSGVFAPEDLRATMPLPRESEAPFYRYFETIEGLRLFWNGGAGGSGDTGQVYIDHVTVTVNKDEPPTAEMTLEPLALIPADTGPVVLDASPSADPRGGPLLYQWFVNGAAVSATTSPVSSARLPVGDHTVRLRVVDTKGNTAESILDIIVTPGNLRPVARAGDDQTLVSNDRLLAPVTLDGSASFDRDGEIVAYEWRRGGELLQAGADPVLAKVLPVGLHTFELTAVDDVGATGTDTVRIRVNGPDGGDVEVIYRENFSRPRDGTEMGPWEVGWNLMRPDGEPVPSVKWDGNAHRSLSTNSAAPYRTKVNADPTDTEYDSPNARGHMWMNQMPFLNATPAEWMLWTEEYTVDTDRYEITAVEFHATDGSPERVKNSLAVRIEGEWYLFWDGRVKSQWNSWRLYRIDFATTGWYRFDPSPVFSIRNAEPVALPAGDIEAFGLYFYKDYGWYVNQVTNFTIHARERVEPPAYLTWQLANFPAEDLLDDALEDTVWGKHADPGRTGMSNFVRYAFGLGPCSESESIAPELTGDGNLRLRFTLNPEATDVEVGIERSTDLRSWSADVDAEWTMNGLEDGLETWTVTVPVPEDSDVFHRFVFSAAEE